MSSGRVLLLSAALAFIVAGPARAHEPAPAAKPAAADRAPADLDGASALAPDLIASVEAIESRLETLRSLPFLSKVKTAALSRKGVRAYMKEVLHREYLPADLAAEEETLRYFGFLSADQRIEPILLDLLESQVAGAYDTERRTLYVVPGPVAGTLALAHELAHALADQHFDLKALQEKAKDDDDRALALSCLIEGEATMVMALWSFESGADPNAPALLGGDTQAALEAAETGMAGVPEYVRESLIFPYLGGASWASEIMGKGGGLKALDAYFREPPESTEQILHPARSLPPRDVPSRIDPSVMDAVEPAGTLVGKRGAMGEFTLRLVLGKPGDPDAARAAEGWDGDEYMLSGPPGSRVLTWVSVWDSEEDAVEFGAAARAWLDRRSAAGGAGTRASGVERHGRVVIVAEGGEGSGSAPAAVRIAIVASRLPSGIEYR